MIDTWQSWVAIVIGFICTKIGWDQRQEIKRTDIFRADTHKALFLLSERVTRVESEIVTEREVREVLHELITPFKESLAKVESKQDFMSEGITEIKVLIAALPKRGDSA